ncbi:MAG: FtsX-like permease family protein [Lentisphaerae bacterium]|nr:FtsX-like permease family protein [Lentisphaerota bacterium]
MMLPSDALRLSLHNILLHKVRSILTSLGIIFGVGSVIAMLAVSEGAKRAALQQIEAMGIDKIIIYSQKPPPSGADSQTSRSIQYAESYGLTNIDLVNLQKMDNIKRVTVVRNVRKNVLKGLDRLDVKLVAVTPDFLEDSGSEIESGRWLTPADMKNKQPVCVIGTEARRKLFALGQTDVVGSLLRIDTESYKIVGVLRNDMGTQYPELGTPGNMVFIPYTLSEALFGSFTISKETAVPVVTQIDYDVFIVSVDKLEYIDNTANRVTQYFNTSHSKVKDWDIIIPLDLLKQREATQNIFTIVMSSIAGISLIVGGIGIMNIMLASVYERRKEIGTRRALGAQKGDILFQFLIETVFLTSMGGILGILLGVGISKIITHYANMPTYYSPVSIIAALLISSFVGVLFGTYPAWKAAQQNPIDVLRSN